MGLFGRFEPLHLLFPTPCAISLPDPVTVTMPPIVAIITCSAHATVRGMDGTRIRLIIA